MNLRVQCVDCLHRLCDHPGSVSLTHLLRGEMVRLGLPVGHSRPLIEEQNHFRSSRECVCCREGKKAADGLLGSVSVGREVESVSRDRVSNFGVWFETSVRSVISSMKAELSFVSTSRRRFR